MRIIYWNNKSNLRDLIGYDEVNRFIKRPKHEYYNKTVLTFDIETTSTYIKGEKFGYCYEWTFSIYDLIFIGRYIIDFKGFTEQLSDYLGLDDEHRAIIWIHNIDFEFQFMQGIINFKDVFAIDSHKVLKAIDINNFEYRCSYKLSGYNLAKLAENLINHKISKLYGDLDYSKIHNPKTPLTEEEINYCINDVLIVKYYIEEQIELYGNITKIPLTNTGRVRKLMQQNTNTIINSKGEKVRNRKYYNKIHNLILTPEDYSQLKQAFQGGFTHANIYRSLETIEEVTSYDFTSSYPAVMISEKFPMSRPISHKIKNSKEFRFYLNNYCCLFDIKFINLREKLNVVENPLSLSKCLSKGSIINNGRVEKADELITTMTDIDFRIIRNFYDWDKMIIFNFKFFHREYLPKEIIETILDLYIAKTELKGVKGKEAEYQNKKGMLNSTYGMMIMDPIRDLISYTDEKGWNIESNNKIKESLEKYNDNIGRNLYYAWGVWITAYARRNLFTGIYELGEDYIYSDTDSVKFTNFNNHKDYFINYNKQIMNKIDKCLNYYNLPLNLARPKTIKGIEKPIGVWDFDGFYTKFKTLGAKRYLTQKLDFISTQTKKGYKGVSIKCYKYELTFAGLGKISGLNHLKKQKKDLFNNFNDQMKIPAEDTGKLTHTYFDFINKDKIEVAEVKDYLGNIEMIKSFSYIHLEPAEFNLGMQEYKQHVIYKRNNRK